MSARENEALVRRYFEEAWDKGNLATLTLGSTVPSLLFLPAIDVHIVLEDASIPPLIHRSSWKKGSPRPVLDMVNWTGAPQAS